jgi:hypothetical protein
MCVGFSAASWATYWSICARVVGSLAWSIDSFIVSIDVAIQPAGA